MKQTIYVVKAEARGDEFTGTVTLDKGAAIRSAKVDWDHLTKKISIHSSRAGGVHQPSREDGGQKGTKNMKINGLKKATHEFNLINKGGCYRRLFSDIWLDRNTGKLWWTEEADRNTYHVNDDPACIKLIGHRETDHVTMAEVKAAAQRACDEWHNPTERTLYVVQEESRGDIEPCCITYDKDMAEANAWGCWNHLTPSERKKARVYVEVYKILAPGKERPEQAWHRLLDEDDDSLKNPVDVLFEQSGEDEGGDDE